MPRSIDLLLALVLAANFRILGTSRLGVCIRAVAAQVRRPSHEQGAGAASPHDPDAAWTRKGGRSHFGYKAHGAVDAGSGLIRRAILTSARINESVMADALVCGDERAVYGDRAYENKQRRARLNTPPARRPSAPQG